MKRKFAFLFAFVACGFSFEDLFSMDNIGEIFAPAPNQPSWNERLHDTVKQGLSLIVQKSESRLIRTRFEGSEPQLTNQSFSNYTSPYIRTIAKNIQNPAAQSDLITGALANDDNLIGLIIERPGNINPGAVRNCQNLRFVIIEDGISVKNGAFGNCPRLNCVICFNQRSAHLLWDNLASGIMMNSFFSCHGVSEVFISVLEGIYRVPLTEFSLNYSFAHVDPEGLEQVEYVFQNLASAIKDQVIDATAIADDETDN